MSRKKLLSEQKGPINKFCEPHLVFKVEKELNPDTACVDGRDVERMTAGVEYAQALKRAYPDLHDAINTVAAVSWARVKSISDKDVRVRTLGAIIEGLRTGCWPVPLYSNSPRHSIIERDVIEIVRWANGLPYSGRVVKKTTFWPQDIADLKAVFSIAKHVKQSQGKTEEVDRILALQAKVLGPRL